MPADTKYWNRLCGLQSYSFLLGESTSVCKVPDKYGNWISKQDTQVIVDDAETKIYELKSALSAFLIYYGMDEDEWSKSVFDNAREALKF